MAEKLTIEQFGSQVKSKYPDYAKFSDLEIGQRMLQKYPVYADRVQPTKPEEVKGGAISNFGKGILKGVGSTVFGIGQLADKVIPGQLLPTEKPDILVPKGTAQKIGFGAEQIGEFFIPVGLAAKGIKVIEGASALSKLSKAGLAGRVASTGIKLAGRAGIGAIEAGGVRAAQTGGDVEEIKKAAELGALGGLAVPIIGAGIGKIKSGFASKATREAEELIMLKGGRLPPGGGGGAVTDARIATKTLSGEGRVVMDKVAKEAVRQGIPEADVALIKGGSDLDKVKMNKMLDIRQSQLTNKRIVDRATDVVGNTFTEKLAMPIEKLNREAGEKLDVVARGLSGKRVDPTDAILQFAGDLERSGITVRANRTLNFKNSNFEGLGKVQSLISNVWKRALRVSRTGDALQLHRTKSYIDEIVNYGKQTEGLSGKAQSLLKSFRHNIDAILDSKFLVYNKVNTQFSDTIKELDNLGAALGRSFRLGESFSDAQAGLAMRRILSNTQSRAEILKLLDNMQKLAKKYGIKVDEDIITQANFADLLEKMLGSEAPTSFLGQIERGVEPAVSVGADIFTDHPVRAALKATKHAFDATRGINQENKINALRELIKTKPKTVFGRKR